jgi:hypothetical protein
VAIREIAAIAPGTLALRSHAKDARELAIHLESALIPVMRSVSLTADWIEQRQIAVTASYDMLDETVILANAATGAVVVTLPFSNSETLNREVYIKKTDNSGNSVTIAARGGDLIDTAASVGVVTEGQTYHLLADGLGNWRILSTIAASGGGGLAIPATAAPIVVNLTPAAVGVSVKYAREDHRHLFDVTIDPTGANAWTGVHAWTPDSNVTPITVNVGSLTSANMVTFNPTSPNLDTVVTYLGNVGAGDETPTANVSMRARASTLTTLGVSGWYVADDITGLTSGSVVSTWTDRSGNGNNLTGAGILGAVSSTSSDPTKRPTWWAAGQTAATPNLSAVVFGGSIAGFGSCGYFTIDTGVISLTFAAGWTFFFIVRDYSTTSQNNYYVGSNTNLGDSSEEMLRCGGLSPIQWVTNEGGAARTYSAPFTHTDGNDIERIVVRASAGGATLNTYLDGVLQTPTADAALANHTFRHFGLHLVGNSILGVYSKSLAEFGFFNRALTNDEITTLDTYLAARVAGTGALAASPLTHWKDTAGVVDSLVDASLNFGIGTKANTPAAKLHVISTTSPQFRVGRDVTDYLSVSVATAGTTTLDPFGSSAGVLIASTPAKNIGFHGATPVAQDTGWAVSNADVDRTFDASSLNVNELADVVGTLISKLTAKGLLGA